MITDMEYKMNIIDLFAGCGGLSLGFEMAGFKVLAAVEMDEWASETYQKNHTDTKMIKSDITKVQYLSDIVDKETIVDGIIGGPPCQGF